MSDRLTERYERLLEAYPEGYRAERGEEILGTLLDGAKPGQRWPTPRETVALLLGALRARAARRSPSFRAYWYGVAHLAVLLVLIPKLYHLIVETQGDVRITTPTGDLRLLYTGVIYLWLAAAALTLGAVLLRAYRAALVAVAVLAGLELVVLGLLATPTEAGQPAYTSMFELVLVGALLAVLRSGRTLRPPSVWMAVALVVAFTAPASYFQVVMVYRWDLLFGLGLLASLLLGFFDIRVPAAGGLYLLATGAYTVAVEASTGAMLYDGLVPYLAGWLGSAVLLAGASLLVQRMVVRL